MFPYKLHQRGEWGYRQDGGLSSQFKVAEAFVHHTENEDAPRITTLRQMYAAARGIQDFHIDTRGWNAIGYHFLIFQPYGSHEHAVTLCGRPLQSVPAAQLDHNQNTVAFAVYGDGRTEELHRSTRFVIEALIRTYCPQVKKIGGHRDVTATTCPGDRFYAAVPLIAGALGIRAFG